jgi:hypothetical protein
MTLIFNQGKPNHVHLASIQLLYYAYNIDQKKALNSLTLVSILRLF